jgi:hypothetical protein
LHLDEFGHEMRYLGLMATALAGAFLTPACAPRAMPPKPVPIVTTTPEEDAALKAWEQRMVRPCKRVGQRMVC